MLTVEGISTGDRIQEGWPSRRFMDDLHKGDNYTVRDLGLAEKGALLVDWARARMPVLAKLKEESEQTKPLAGMRVAGCLHVTKETAVLIEAIRAAKIEKSLNTIHKMDWID